MSSAVLVLYIYIKSFACLHCNLDSIQAHPVMTSKRHKESGLACTLLAAWLACLPLETICSPCITAL